MRSAQVGAHLLQHRLVGGSKAFQPGADTHTGRRVGDKRGSDLA